MNLKKIIFIIACIGTVNIVNTKGFVKEKKASNADRQACCQEFGEQIQLCAKLIEDLAKNQTLLCKETAAFLENENEGVLLTAHKTDLQELLNQAQELNDAIAMLDKKVKSNMVNIQSKRNKQ